MQKRQLRLSTNPSARSAWTTHNLRPAFSGRWDTSSSAPCSSHHNRRSAIHSRGQMACPDMRSTAAGAGCRCTTLATAGLNTTAAAIKANASLAPLCVPQDPNHFQIEEVPQNDRRTKARLDPSTRGSPSFIIGDKGNEFGAVWGERLRLGVIEADDHDLARHEHVAGDFSKGSPQTAPLRNLASMPDK